MASAGSSGSTGWRTRPTLPPPTRRLIDSAITPQTRWISAVDTPKRQVRRQDRPNQSLLCQSWCPFRFWTGHSTGRARTRLWTVELSLLLPHHPVDLRRERGVLLVAGGARELVGYAELVAAADPAAAERAREQAGAARARLN